MRSALTALSAAGAGRAASWRSARGTRMTFKSELLDDLIEFLTSSRRDVARGLRIVLAPPRVTHLIEGSHPAVEILLVDQHHGAAASARDPVDRALVSDLLRDARGVTHEVGHGDDFFHMQSIL